MADTRVRAARGFGRVEVREVSAGFGDYLFTSFSCTLVRVLANFLGYFLGSYEVSASVLSWFLRDRFHGFSSSEVGSTRCSHFKHVISSRIGAYRNLRDPGISSFTTGSPTLRVVIERDGC